MEDLRGVHSPAFDCSFESHKLPRIMGFNKVAQMNRVPKRYAQALLFYGQRAMLEIECSDGLIAFLGQEIRERGEGRREEFTCTTSYLLVIFLHYLDLYTGACCVSGANLRRR